MEEQKVKKIKTNCEPSSMSKSTRSFPLDLTSEILLRLPAKSVVRFRCVSKLWSSITTDPYFTNSFKTLSSTKPRLLFCYKDGDELFVLTIQQNHQNSNKSYTCSPPIVLYHMKFPKYTEYSETELVQGLICFEEEKSGKLIVWNPSMRQFLTLPKPIMNCKEMKFFLGSDPIEGKHKVVCMPSYKKVIDECRVLTLGSAQESWRNVEIDYIEMVHSYLSNGRCINGVIYFIAALGFGDGSVLMRFDVRSEKMDTIQLPFSGPCHTLITYEGRLACVDDTMGDSIRLWILDDSKKKREWWSKDFSAPWFHYDESKSISHILKGITDAGEFIYAPLGFFESFHVLFYDPERNSYKKVDLKGVVGDERHLHMIQTFPNHIEKSHVFVNLCCCFFSFFFLLSFDNFIALFLIIFIFLCYVEHFAFMSLSFLSKLSFSLYSISLTHKQTMV